MACSLWSAVWVWFCGVVVGLLWQLHGLGQESGPLAGFELLDAVPPFHHAALGSSRSPTLRWRSTRSSRKNNFHALEDSLPAGRPSESGFFIWKGEDGPQAYGAGRRCCSGSGRRVVDAVRLLLGADSSSRCDCGVTWPWSSTAKARPSRRARGQSQVARRVLSDVGGRKPQKEKGTYPRDRLFNICWAPDVHSPP